MIADFKQYQDALAYVDNLIKHNFPAGAVAIVGSDLRTVERVRGKVNYTRLAIAGATTGSWVGLIFGFLFGTQPETTESQTVGSVLAAVFIGAGLGMLFNVVRYSLSKNKRSFVSQSSVVAANYQIQVPAQLADQARAVPAISAEA